MSLHIHTQRVCFISRSAVFYHNIQKGEAMPNFFRFSNRLDLCMRKELATDGGASFSEKINLSNTNDSESERVELDSDEESVIVTWLR
jgi:hypothetical protein